MRDLTNATDTGLKLDIAFVLPEEIEMNSVIFAEGSYFTQKLPEEIEFIYVTIKNTSENRRTLIKTQFELCYSCEVSTAHPTGFSSIPLDINFPSHVLYGKKINPDESIVFACLYEYFTASARALYPTEKAYFRAMCEILDNRCAYSVALPLDMSYPISPMQDIELIDYTALLKQEQNNYFHERDRIREKYGSLTEYANLHYSLGLHKVKHQKQKMWHCKEYAPDATALYLAGQHSNFEDREEYKYTQLENGYWELYLPEHVLQHGFFHELHLYGKYMNGKQVRVPAFASWVEQDRKNPEQWCARLWCPEKSYTANSKHKYHKIPLIYEAHIGIARDSTDVHSVTDRGFGSYQYFAHSILPKIKASGYNTVQLMGVLEHPLYKSFGYQIGSYFAPSHRFGTLDDFKMLVDKAHSLDLVILLDIAHSHSCSNTEQGLNKYDTGAYFFHDDRQTQWGTPSFDYGKEMTRRFLLSNCRYWMEEFKVDGFRFDAVGSMIFVDEGFGDDFSQVKACFYTPDNKPRRDADGILYLGLANTLIHEIYPQACTIAEEFSGAPGITSPEALAGLGFDYRFAMGLPDFWAKYILAPSSLWKMWHECTNHRHYEHTISYVECHDQCINGEDSMIWRLIGDDMYFKMSPFTENWNVSRGVALIKLMKLITFISSDKGYMNFMGNEFGHPEWIDADTNPYRQWQLANNDLLLYTGIGLLDRDMLKLACPEVFSFAPRLRLLDDAQLILLFERGSYLCAFNFHETKPSHFSADVTPGKYREVLSSDEIEYSGHANLSTEKHTEHFTDSQSGVYEQKIKLYLPPLTALILLRE